ncbi:hexosaminidase [Psychromicrobium silvestre]|uniref:beta-N-acetylhexosaminidase n=1 Tax=Psychromicrobium silvestre TaxID=1645614 RepID=A0A7Y9S4E8_9MICC|nr:beta-N-acetylhexosaminidase [Psychromicrobium silvestre]NYE93920.1 hexosaminidase [Psychromicrobium silvestre]
MPTLLPRPNLFVPRTGYFQFTALTSVTAPDELNPVLFYLQSALRPASGFPLKEGQDGNIRLALSTELAAEAFRLEISPESVQLTGGDQAGVFYGCVALLQLLPPEIYRRALVTGTDWSVPACLVEDAPRFRWRGAMLDVARHFLPKHEVLRFIDLMAMHRLNILHFHLTEDQGWRIEIRRYPKLTEIGSWRTETQVGAVDGSPSDGRPHGGSYTQADIREIVAYAQQRQITVVPEIESPGHVQAALAAYPELGVSGQQLPVFTRWGVNPNVLNAEESTVEFFQNVLDEVMDLFPSPFIGIGGDECPKEQWLADPRTLERMAELGVADGEGLQAWFIGRLAEHVTARGRRIFGWDEILEGELATTALVASWRGLTGAVSAAKRGHDVIACPDDMVYLDYRQSESAEEPIPVAIAVSVEDAYLFEPVPAELSAEEAMHVLGGQANIWTEHMDSPRTVDYFAFPRLSAIAEALWITGDRDVEEFRPRLEEHLARLDALGVEYRRATGPLSWQQRPGVPGRPSSREARATFMEQLVANIVQNQPGESSGGN